MIGASYGNVQYNNLPDANYGQQSPVALGKPFLPLPSFGLLNPPVPRFQSTDKQGFGVDLNRDNRYTRGQDAILAMDLNRDGRISDQEIQRSRTLLNSYNGNFDLNNDGKVSKFETLVGQKTQKEARSLLGEPGCGGIGADRFAAAGGKVLIDKDRNGSFSPNETFDPYNVPGFCGGNQALTNLNPGGGTTGMRPRDGGNPYISGGLMGRAGVHH